MKIICLFHIVAAFVVLLCGSSAFATQLDLHSFFVAFPNHCGVFHSFVQRNSQGCTFGSLSVCGSVLLPVTEYEQTVYYWTLQTSSSCSCLLSHCQQTRESRCAWKPCLFKLFLCLCSFKTSHREPFQALFTLLNLVYSTEAEGKIHLELLILNAFVYSAP